MAKQVIVLRQEVGDTILVHGVVWLAVPPSFQAIAANPLATTHFALATSAEIALLQVGSIAEVTFQAAFAKGTPLATMKTEFLRTASLAIVQFTSSQTVALQFYGTFWDGATWSA